MKPLTSTPSVRRSLLFSLVALALLLVVHNIPAWAQAANTGTISGSVTDPQGAVIAGAAVTLTNKDNGSTQKTTSKDDGYFFFANVPPGTYEMTVASTGFATAKVSVQVRVGLSTNAGVKLKIGAKTETVEVTAAAAELQTLDASVGNVLDQNALDKLPSLNRDATALLLIQPLASPGFNSGAPGAGESNLTGGGIAGARADQNTFMVDGGDASSNTEGGGGYAQQANGGFIATPRASIPTPVESLQEFRVVTNNSNTFSRSAGAEVQMVTRSGTNAWHGAIYENNQNTNYNANSWTNNRNGQPRNIWIDNRFGGRLGGPIKKDKAFFFIMYEGRDQKKGFPFTRLVPSDLMRQGILQWQDAGGVVHQVNLATSTACGSGGGSPCDPRGIGISPVIKSIWAMEPHGNDASLGDGLNAIGFDSSVPLIVRDNFAVAKFDYKLNDKWDFNTSYHYAVSDGMSPNQIDIGGVVKGDTSGSPVSTRPVPNQPRYLTLGATGHLTSNLTTDAHFNWLRHWWQWSPISPFPQVAGTTAAVQIYAESAGSSLVPMNIDTQSARRRVWNGKDFTWGSNTAWLKGKHMISFGGEFRHEHFTHTRDDKVVGSLTTPMFYADKTSDIADFSDIFRPQGCTTPSCISNWQNAYVATTGMIARAGRLLTRAADFTPNAPGTPLHQDTIVDWYNLYFTDSWRMTPSLTVTLGLGWGAQTPPYENTGLQTIMVDSATGKPIIFNDFLASAAASAAAGTVYGPTLAFAPIKSLGRKYPYDAEWNDFEPRLSVAWNPSSFLKPIFGEKQSVIRAGYGRYHDRLNGVGLVMTPALGIGFGNTVNCKKVKIGGSCGGSKTDPTNSFRIGVDGSNITLPSLGSITGNLIPGTNSPYELLDFRIDPKRKVGVEDTWTLSIERQLPGKTLLEIGYVGRVAHHLYGAGDLGQVPYMLKMGGQTFASAYDGLAKQVRACPTSPPAAQAACLAAVTPQPFWEAALGPGGTVAAATSAGCPATSPGCETTNFRQGHAWIIFDNIIGLPIQDNQMDDEQITTSNGNSNYHAGYISVRKQVTHGLMAQVNYTYSHSLDTVGFTQENVFISPSDNFNPHRDYGPSLFDRRHVLNMFFVYELPFGKGHYLGGNNVLDKIFGGWTLSGSFAAASGIPLAVFDGSTSGECDQFGNGDGSGACQNSQIALPGAPTSASPHYSHDPAVCGSAAAAAKGCVVPFGGTPGAAVALFREPFFSDQRAGAGYFRSYPRWNTDMALSKKIKLTERVNMGFGIQAVNIFNHMEFVDPVLDVSKASTFGVTTGQYSSPRFLNLNIRFDF